MSIIKRLIGTIKGSSPADLLSSLEGSDRFSEQAIRLYKAVFLDQDIPPQRVMISPTDKCNLSCPICWRLQDAKKMRLDMAKKKDMSLKKLKDILDDLKNLGVGEVDFTGGGEPLVRKDILDIIKAIKKRGMTGSFTTNATFIDKELASEIVAAGHDDICVSLDSPLESINDRIRGKWAFKRTMLGLRNLSEARKKQNSNLPVLRIGTVLTSLNYSSLDRLIQIAEQFGVVAINLSVLLEWESNKPFWIPNNKQKEALEHIERFGKMAESKRIYTNYRSILEYGLGRHDPPKICFAPYTMAFINADGDVMVCCTLAAKYSNLLGNVHKTPFSMLWKGETMQRFRKKMLAGGYPKECSLCIPEFTQSYNRLAGEVLAIKELIDGKR